MIDFVHQYRGHRLEFTYGSPLAAHFVGESVLVRFKDHVLLRNRSGKVGIWELYSVVRKNSDGEFTAVGRLRGYKEDYDKTGTRGVFTAMEKTTPVAVGQVSEPLSKALAPLTPAPDYLDRRP